MLMYNCFYINHSFIHQMKGTATSTIAVVANANLSCGHLEVKVFNKLPDVLFYDIVEFFLKNYIDLFHMT